TPTTPSSPSSTPTPSSSSPSTEHRCTVPVSPRNGMRDCRQSERGVHCTLHCMEGYAFALPPPEEYFCSFQDYLWKPESGLPFPDCSVLQPSHDVIQPARLTFL
ncbi:hypothetical protein Ahia01_001397800, partial [Argonauta hians]